MAIVVVLLAVRFYHCTGTTGIQNAQSQAFQGRFAVPSSMTALRLQCSKL